MSSTISSDQKKSIAITVLLYGTLLLILFFIRFWPPANLEELVGPGGGGGGVTVNFGDSDLGSGANYKKSGQANTNKSSSRRSNFISRKFYRRKRGHSAESKTIKTNSCFKRRT